jgi:type 1 glutamine amidotransferase
MVRILSWGSGIRRVLAALFALTAAAPPISPQQTPQRPRLLLAIGDVHRKNYQHDAVSHALATIERLGRESGTYKTYIRTDTQLLTKQPIDFAEHSTVTGDHYLTLNDFDAILFYGIGELELSDRQKADFLSFIRDDGKGFLGVHTAVTAFMKWPEYGEMIGGYFDDHPWEVFDAPVIVEDPAFSAMKAFPRAFTTHEEIYQLKNFSRERVRVLARLDETKLDLGNPRVHRTDGDFPVAWARSYGKGRVFYSNFGHSDESWDNPAMQTMWLEAIKWSMGLTDADVRPRPKP